MTAYRPVLPSSPGRYAVIGCKLKQNANEGCNSCASLAGLVLSFIACFILHVIESLPALRSPLDGAMRLKAAASYMVISFSSRGPGYPSLTGRSSYTTPAYEATPLYGMPVFSTLSSVR